MKSHSVLRYIGAKSKALSFLVPKMPTNINKYVEPFCGSASVGLSVVEKGLAGSYHFNDIDPDLIAMFKCCQDRDTLNKVAVELNKLKNLETFVKKDLYREYKAILDNNNNGLDDSARAIMYFFINRCSYSGGGKRAGFSTHAAERRFTQSSINKLVVLGSMLENVYVTGKDYSECLVGLSEDDFVFIDPPYLLPKGKNNLYKGHENFDHSLLAARLRELPCKFMATYNDCDEIWDLYEDWCRIDMYSLKYGSSRKEGQEICIRN